MLQWATWDGGILFTLLNHVRLRVTAEGGVLHFGYVGGACCNGGNVCVASSPLFQKSRKEGGIFNPLHPPLASASAGGRAAMGEVAAGKGAGRGKGGLLRRGERAGGWLGEGNMGRAERAEGSMARRTCWRAEWVGRGRRLGEGSMARHTCWAASPPPLVSVLPSLLSVEIWTATLPSLSPPWPACSFRLSTATVASLTLSPFPPLIELVVCAVCERGSEVLVVCAVCKRGIQMLVVCAE